MNITLWIKRIFIYCLGLFSIAIGVALAIGQLVKIWNRFTDKQLKEFLK